MRVCVDREVNFDDFDISDGFKNQLFASFDCLLSPPFGLCGSSISSVNLVRKVPNGGANLLASRVPALPS